LNDITETISAKDKLAGSRAALLHEMGFNALPRKELVPSSGDTSSAPVPSLALQAIERPSPWVSMGRSAVKNWWAKHPANAALTLAKPALARYAQVHPGKVVACGAAVGVVLYVVRPWRLLSVTTIVALVFKRSTIAGMVTRLAQYLPALPASHKPMPRVVGVPDRRL
jgi:hypothetical protein